MNLEDIMSIILSAIMIVLSLSLLIVIIDTHIMHRKRAKMMSEMDKDISALLHEIINNEPTTDDTTENKNDKSDVDYDSMSVAELKSIARQRKIKGYYVLKRNELLNILKNER